MAESMHSHTGCNYLTLLHCALSNDSSNCLPERMYKHNGCICSTFLHCAFSNASSNCLPERMQSHTGCICLIKSSPDQIRMLQPITILSLITLSLSWIQDYQDQKTIATYNRLYLFLSRIYSYSYSVFIFEPNIFVFVFGFYF